VSSGHWDVTAGKIERIELFHIDAPLPSPLFPVWIPGYPQYRQCHTLLAVTTRDGLTGFATGVAFEHEREGLGDFIGQFLLGIDPYDPDAASERLRQSSFLGWRNSWMENAFWDLAAKSKQIPLHELLAEKLNEEMTSEAPEAVEVYASFWEHRPPKIRAESIERAMRLGFKGAKVNLRSFSETEDREKLALAREVGGEGFKLMAHARQAWTVSLVEKAPVWDVRRALRMAEVCKEHGVLWLQEPLHSERWDELADLSRQSPVPIAGGDITITFVPLKAFLSHGCYSILTPDAAFAGLASVVRTMKLCKAKGLHFSPSSNSDGLGLAANLHALVAWQRMNASPTLPYLLEFPWEPPAMIPEHRDALLKEPLQITSDGMLPVPEGPGLGVDLDVKALRRYGRRFYTLTPVRFIVSTARRSGLRQTAEFANQKPGRRRTRERASS
jgi:L-alanine-DL-glutamate epimerase-like enolase superfamily enzyme